jgi:anti-sigma B factor antagonist
MQSDFLVDTHTAGRTIVLTLSGDLDLVSSPALQQAFDRIPDDCELIVVDLRGLEFMDSTGLHILYQAQQDAQRSGRRFAVVRGGDQVQRLLNLTGVGETLTIVDSPEQLLEVDQAPGAP